MSPGDRERNQIDLVARWADDLAHEIKNPFHAMVINLELVKRRAGDVDAARERAEVVESELHRVHGLIDSLLKLVRPWPDGDHVNVASVVDALLPVFRARAGLHHIDYRHQSGDGPGGVPMAPGDLALVLLNLVDNAMEAVMDGPSTGGAGADRDDAGDARSDAAVRGPWVRTAVETGDDGVVIRVADSGTGFPQLDGDPFQARVTSRPGRAGLGLAVSRGLVEGIRGTLVAEEGTGDGTTLVVTLPR